MTRHYSQVYVPKTKAGRLAELLPTWKGSKTDLRKMTNKRLGAILRDKKVSAMNSLMRKDHEVLDERWA